MSAVFAREFRSYFKSPLGYVFVGAVCLFTGLYFYAYNLYGGEPTLSRLYSVLFSVVLFLIPILTMRLLSEDMRAKTDQLLMTAPVSSAAVAVGKYLAALTVYAIAISSTLLDAAVLSRFADVGWAQVAGNFVGLLLLGGALIAVCLFLSSLTESQLIAAVGGFLVSILLILLEALSPLVSNPLIKQVFQWLNFSTRYQPFTYGVFALENAVFFLSVAALFVALTVMRLERRRWG